MRTAIIILAGFVLWAICLGVAKVLGAGRPSAMTMATAVFLIVWLIAAAWNMYVGVSSAGYSVAEELPIFLVIFLLPALVALVVRWRFL
jgi:hypothetical protein